MNTPPPKADRILEIARAIAAKTFAAKSTEKKVTPTKEVADHIIRGPGTAEIIRNPDYDTVYSMNIERKYVTRYNLNRISSEMVKMAGHKTVSVKSLVRTLRECLKASFFGCEVNIGISPDSSLTILDFLGDDDYKRRVQRGQSSCFECLDQKDIVLQVTSVSAGNTSDKPKLTSGETVIYVPLIGSAGGLGVIEIHGLRSPSLTNTKNFQRSAELVTSLIKAQDFSFIKHTRLWRLPSARSGGEVSELDKKDYSKAPFPVVQGKITAAITELHGVPFFGGARYNLRWEDGLVEEAVPANNLIEVYKNTPQSLGCTSEVTEELLEELMKYASEAAITIENQRTVEALRRTQDSVNVPNLRDMDICERCLSSLIGIVRGMREACLVGFEKLNLEGTIEDKPYKMHLLQRKNPKVRVITRGLNHNPVAMAEKYMLDREKLMQGINPRPVSQATKSRSVFKDKDDEDAKVIKQMLASDLIVYPDVTVEERKYEHRKDSGVEWIVTEIALPSYYRWPQRVSCSRFFLVTLKEKEPNEQAQLGDLYSIEAISKILKTSFTISCEKDMRKKQRRQSMLVVDRSLYDWRDLPTPEDICAQILSIVGDVAPGTNSYAGMLRAGGKYIDYIAASESSAMVGNVLAEEEGISFSVIDHQETVIVREGQMDKRKLINVGDYVNVQYGKIFDRAKIRKDRGHGFYDVEYGPESFFPREAGVPLDRITPLITSYRMKAYGEFKFPVMSIPVKHRDKVIGVIGMDTFDGVLHAPYDPQPEPGLKLFLEHMGKVLGSCVDIQRKKKALRIASKVSRNPNASNSELFAAIFDIIFSNLLYVTSTALVNATTQEGDIPRDQDTINILAERGELLSKDARAALATFDSIRSSKKPVQFKGDKMAWIVCRIKIAAKSESKGLLGRKKKKSTVQIKDYIICVISKRPIAEVDAEFLDAVQKFSTLILQNIESRKQKAQIRTEAILAIEEICRNWKDYVNNRAEFFDEICEAINTCYMSANVYVGQLEAHAQSLEYTYASKFSRMKGKKLLRSYPDGVSFRAIDNFTHVACTKSDHEIIKSLHHYGNPANFDYPFIVLPLAAYLDSPLGVLAADACEDMTAESDTGGSVSEIVSFFYSVAGQVGRPVKSFLVYDATNELYHIEDTAKSHWTGFRGVKSILSRLLPYVETISEVEISRPPPTEDDGMTTTHGLVYIFRLIEATCFPPAVVSPLVSIQWRGMPVFSCPCGSSDLKDDATATVLIIRIPSEVKFSDVELRIFLRGQVNGVARDIGRKSITLQDMMNSGALLYEHDIQCIYTPLPDVHAGSVQFVSRLYSDTDVVRLIFQKISCTNVLGFGDHVDENAVVDSYCIVRWKGVEIARTEPARNTHNPVWKDLNICIKPTTREVTDGAPLLCLEFWDTDALDKGVLLGTKQFSVQDLQTHGSSRTWFLEAVVQDPVTNAKVRQKTGGELQFMMSLLLASDLTETIAREELSIPFLSSAIKNKSGNDGNEKEDELDPTKARECILQFLSIKNLRMYLPDQTPLSPSVENKCHMLNPFCIAYLNGEEIGRTGSARLKGLPSEDTTFSNTMLPQAQTEGAPHSESGPLVAMTEHSTDAEYIWSEEIVHVNVPNSVELDVCSLRLDIYTLDQQQKGVLFGSLVISEKSFTSLLCAPTKKQRWYDLLSLSKFAGSPYMCGEILLSGHPALFKFPEDHAIHMDVIPPALSIKTTAFSFESSVWNEIVSSEICDMYSFEVFWNGDRMLNKVFDTSNCISKSDGTLIIDLPEEESVPFCQPHDISLAEANIHIDLVGHSGSNMSILARGLIDGTKIIKCIDSRLRRNIACEIHRVTDKITAGKWNEVSPGGGAKAGVSLLNVGPVGEDDFVETDGRTLWLDVLGACGLVSPAYTELRRPNAFCKIFWNEEFVGQTSVMWNSTDPVWSRHRYNLPVPKIDVVDESLELCMLRIETWNISSRSANPASDFLGCVEITGETLQQVIRMTKPTVTWHPLEMHNDMPTSEQEYVCSRNGAVKIRLAYASRVVNEKVTDNAKGGEHLIRINSAIQLKQVDNFSKTNAFVIVYWNDNEVGRTEVIEKELNPVWTEEIFLLRVPEGEFLRDQKLQLHVYDFSGGSTGDLLGQSIVLHGHQLVSFLQDTFENTHVIPLLPDSELTDDENKFVGGSLSVSFKEIKVAPVNDPVKLYSDAFINIQSAQDILISNFFEQCADPTCVLYWYSLFDSPTEVEIGRTEMMWKTTNPVWKPGKIVVKVPLVDEWTSVFVRIDVLDIAATNDKTFLGSVTLSGWNLKKILERTGAAASEPHSFNIEDTIRFHKLVKHSVTYAPVSVPDAEVRTRGTIQVNGGILTDDESMALEGNESVGLAGSLGTDEKKDGDNRSITTRKSEASLGTLETEKEKKVVFGNKVEFRILSVNNLTIPVEMESTSGKHSDVIYYVAKFNEKVAKVAFTQGEEKVSTDIVNISYASGNTISFTFFLPEDNNPSNCSMEIDIWVSENKLHNIEGQDSNDLFLGFVEFQGTDLVQLLRPKAGEKTFPLKGRNKSEVPSSLNRFVRGSSITLSGRVPDLVRTLSSKSLSRGPIGSNNWRAKSQSSLKMPSMMESVDPALKKETFQIHVCEAGGLSKASGLMGFHDIYADVYWRGEKIGSTEKMKCTAGGDGNCEVVWENEVFILVKPEGERITECSLSIEIHEKKSIGSGSVFLGTVSWEEDLLLEFLHVKEPTWHKLLTAYGRPSEEQKRVQGKVFIGAKCLDEEVISGAKAGSWEFDTSLPLPEDMKDVEFSVLAATGLGKADKFGKSDPFCIVKWNGVEIGKSEVVKKTLDPIWEDATYKVRTPCNLGPLAIVPGQNISTATSTDNVLAKRKSFVAPSSAALDFQPPARGERRRVAMPIHALTQKSFAARTDCELSVEVWDWNASGNSLFLGCVELKGPELASFMEVKSIKRETFKLTTTKKMPKGSQKLVKGSIEFLVSATVPEKEAFAGRDIEVEILAAKNLTKVDRFGLADPYCIVRWNHKVCGKTNVIKNNLNPVWKNELFQMRTRGPDTLKDSIVYVELWDHNLVGQGHFLGSIQLSGPELEAAVMTNDPTWYTLQASPYLPKSTQTRKLSGQVQMRLGFGGDTGGSSSNVASFEIAVLCAENISAASFFGDVDSFCVVKSNGREIGTTAVVAKSNNPKWSGERFVAAMHTHTDPESGERSSSTVISIEIWSMLALGRGDFLGGVTLTYQDLLQLAEDCVSVKRSANTWKQLEKSPSLPESKQKHIQGRIRLGCKNFGSKSVEEIGLSGESTVKMSWPTPAPMVLGTNIGLPSFELCILSCTDLVVPTKGRKLIIPDPFCLVYVNGEESGMTTVCSNTCNPTWSKDEKISIRIPENVDQQTFSISIEVYNMLAISKGEFLGRVVFTFWSLFCLQNGTFTFHLTPQLDDPDQFIKASITFSLNVYQPMWRSVRAYESPCIERSLTVLSGASLPDVNGVPPTTKVAIVVEGGIRSRSSTVSTNADPKWLSPACCDLSIDYRKQVRVVLQVLFLDSKDQREVCIGEVAIPNEFLLRPPVDPFELWLTPPSKAPPKMYDFVVDGSLTLTLTSSGGPERQSLWSPWSTRCNGPDLAYEVEDISEVAMSSLYVGKEKRLTSSQLDWIGTASVFTSANILAPKKEWLLVPLQGMGLVVDGHTIGTHPLKQYCICVERPLNKLSRSDTAMVSELYDSLQSCLVTVQRREIYRYIRQRSLDKLKTFFENMLRNNVFSLNAVFTRMARVMSAAFPGATFFISLVSKDNSHMNYSIYDSTIDSDGDPLFFTLWDGQGLEWESVGRDAFRRDICNVAGLKPERLSHIIPISFCRFQQFRAPRICAPLRSGDASMGVVGLENFDVLKAGAYEDLADLKEIKGWLSDVSDLCGDVIYSGREKKVLKILESYVLFSSSSRKGLIRMTLEHGLSVLQGCRLMEIWSHEDKQLKSIATSWPESMAPPSRWIILKGIRVKFIVKHSEDSSVSAISEAMSNFFFRKKKAIVPPPQSVASSVEGEPQEDSIAVDTTERGTPCGYILGIYYGGFEQYQYVPYFANKKETEETFDQTFSDIKLFLSNDRNISISVYCIDQKLAILDQFSGLFQLVTLKEKQASVQLLRGTKSSNHFLFTSSVAWPSAATKAAQRTIAIKALKSIEKFTLHIHRAYGLTKTDIVGSSDPFCEIYWCDKLIGKTGVIQDNLDPEWDEMFELPSEEEEENADHTCRIEVWGMGFIGKDAFLGQVEIQLDQLLLPPISDIEVPLQPKESFSKAKNKDVGGTLILSHTVDKKSEIDEDGVSAIAINDSDDESEDNYKGAKYPLTSLERRTIEKYLDLDDPVIRLTVDRAEGLGKADLLGQSDPYVKVYRIDGVQKDRDCDPVAATRVIQSNLNPVWNEDLIVALNVKIAHQSPESSTDKKSRAQSGKKESTKPGLLDDWPTLILEVWDKDTVGDGKFLGEVILTPPEYALTRNYTANLKKSKEKPDKANKLVQGSIHLKFMIQENSDKSSFQKYFFGPNRTLHLSTIVHVNIVSAKSVAKISKGFKKEVINPYCILRWNREKIGETAFKKNSVDPTWANEKFSFDISNALVDFKWADLTIEMWSKRGDIMDEAINFLGEVKIPMLDLLHPSQGATIKKELRTKSDAATGAPPKLTGGVLFFRISRSQLPQRVAVKYKEVKMYPMDIRSQDADDSIESRYSHERVRVVTSDPIPLDVVLDPEAERRRQRYERLDLPALLNKYDSLNERYLQSPFDQIGLISELHLGQTVNSFDHNAPTLLHIGEGDMHLMPVLVPKIDMSTEISSYEAEFVQDLQQPDSDGEEVDLMAEPPKEQIQVKREPDMCLVCRYPKAMIPRRDTVFMKSLRETMVKSLTLFEQREKRLKEREIVLNKLSLMHTNMRRYSLEDIILTALRDVEYLFKCSVDIYLLQSGSDSSSERTYLLPCSSETGYIDDNIYPNDVSEFVKLSAKVCRHSVLLQFYRGDSMVAGMGWRKEFSQSSVVSLDSIADDISVVEGRGICHQLGERALVEAGMGACAVPLMLGQEVMLGMMVLSGTDKLPHSIYRRERKDGLSKDNTSETPLTIGRISEDNIETREMFEEGTTECMRDLGMMLGTAVFAANMQSAIRDVKTFPVRDDTDPEDVIRYTFRRLLEALPMLVEISIWKVWVVPESEDSTKIEKVADSNSAPPKGEKSFFSSMFGPKKAAVVEMEELPEDVPKLSDGISEMLVKCATLVQEAIEAKVAELEAETIKIEAGFFKSEAATDILTTGNEKILYQQLYEIDEGTAVRSGASGRKQSLGGRRHSKVIAKPGNNKRTNVITAAGAQVQFAISRHEYSRVVPWMTDIPCSLKKEAFAGVQAMRKALLELADSNSDSDSSSITNDSNVDQGDDITGEALAAAAAAAAGVGDEDNDDGSVAKSGVDGNDEDSLVSKSERRDEIAPVMVPPTLSKSNSFFGRSSSAMRLGSRVFGSISQVLTRENLAEVASTSSEPPMEDPCIKAHIEICRCVDTLKLKSFHLGTGGGIYLSMIERKPDHVVDKILERKFKSNEIMRERAMGVAESSPPKADVTPAAPVPDLTGKRKPRPGASNVKSGDTMIPLSDAKGPPPQFAAPPPPKAPRPTPKEDKKGGKNKDIGAKSAGIKTADSSATGGALESKRNEAAATTVGTSRNEYFLAVKTDGVGGDMGWGVIGEAISKDIDTMVQTMSTVLAKVVAAKIKAGKDPAGSSASTSAQNSRRNSQSTSM